MSVAQGQFRIISGVIGTRGHIALGSLVMYSSVCYHLRNGLEQEDMHAVSHSNGLFYVLSLEEWVGTRGHVHCVSQ